MSALRLVPGEAVPAIDSAGAAVKAWAIVADAYLEAANVSGMNAEGRASMVRAHRQASILAGRPCAFRAVEPVRGL